MHVHRLEIWQHQVLLATIELEPASLHTSSPKTDHTDIAEMPSRPTNIQLNADTLHIKSGRDIVAMTDFDHFPFK